MAQLGLGEEQDYVQALDWYYKAAAQGNPNAQEISVICISMDWAWKRIFAQAETWYYKAAGQGNSNAENQLGYMNQYGLGIPPDLAQALAWYRMAADQGQQDGEGKFEGIVGTSAERGRGAVAGSKRSGSAGSGDAGNAARANREFAAARLSISKWMARLEESLAEPGAAGANAPVLGALSLRKEADKYRTEAARLRAELAGIGRARGIEHAGAVEGPYSNCFRKAANCCFRSAISSRNSATSDSKRENLSAFSPPAAAGASRTADEFVGSTSPDNRWT